MSPLIPGRCTACGRVLTPPIVEIEDSTDVNLVVMGEGQCPCGGTVELIRGTFNVVDGAIEMLSGPAWSWRLVEELGLALRRAVEQRTDPADELEAVDRRAARSFRAATVGKSIEFRLAVAMALHALIVTDYEQGQRNARTIVEALTNLLRFVAEHGRLPGR